VAGVTGMKVQAIGGTVIMAMIGCVISARMTGGMYVLMHAQLLYPEA